MIKMYNLFSDWNDRCQEQPSTGSNQVRVRAVPLVSHPLRVVQERHEGDHRTRWGGRFYTAAR